MNSEPMSPTHAVIVSMVQLSRDTQLLFLQFIFVNDYRFSRSVAHICRTGIFGDIMALI